MKPPTSPMPPALRVELARVLCEIEARLSLPPDHSANPAPVRTSPTAGATTTRRGGGSPRTRPVAAEVSA